jgi:hypothetical protein
VSGNRAGAIASFVIAVLLCFSAIRTLSHRDAPSLSDSSGLGVSRAVGAFLPSIGALILGVWLLSKRPPSRRERD